MDQMAFPCEYCDQGFRKQEGLRRHQTTKHSDQNIGERIKCSHCDRVYSSQMGVSNHMKNHHSHKDTDTKIVEEYTCETCGGIFNSNALFKKHVRIEHKDITNGSQKKRLKSCSANDDSSCSNSINHNSNRNNDQDLISNDSKADLTKNSADSSKDKKARKSGRPNSDNEINQSRSESEAENDTEDVDEMALLNRFGVASKSKTIKKKAAMRPSRDNDDGRNQSGIDFESESEDSSADGGTMEMANQMAVSQETPSKVNNPQNNLSESINASEPDTPSHDDENELRINGSLGSSAANFSSKIMKVEQLNNSSTNNGTVRQAKKRFLADSEDGRTSGSATHDITVEGQPLSANSINLNIKRARTDEVLTGDALNESQSTRNSTNDRRDATHGRQLLTNDEVIPTGNLSTTRERAGNTDEIITIGDDDDDDIADHAETPHLFSNLVQSSSCSKIKQEIPIGQEDEIIEEKKVQLSQMPKKEKNIRAALGMIGVAKDQACLNVEKILHEQKWNEAEDRDRTEAELARCRALISDLEKREKELEKELGSAVLERKQIELDIRKIEVIRMVRDEES